MFLKTRWHLCTISAPWWKNCGVTKIVLIKVIYLVRLSEPAQAPMFYWNIFLYTTTHINQGTLINSVIVGGKPSVGHDPCFFCVWSQRELWAVLHKEHEYRALFVYCCYRLTYSINKLILQNKRKGKVGMSIDTVCVSSSVPSKCLIYKCMYWNTACM